MNFFEINKESSSEDDAHSEQASDAPREAKSTKLETLQQVCSIYTIRNGLFFNG